MKAWDITRKDLKLLVRDVRTFVVLLALPVLFIWIIGMITGKLTGFHEPNRVLNISMVDQIDYEALGFDEEGEALDGDEAKRRKKQARDTFVKVYNGIQSKRGFEVKEVVVKGDDPARSQAAMEARQDYEKGDAHAALRVGPDFFKRVLALSHRDIMDNKRGGIGFRFTPPQELSEFAVKRDGLEQRIARVLKVKADEIEVFREDVDLENAEIVFKLPKSAAEKFFDDRWKNGKDSVLYTELSKAAQPLELRAISPRGLYYGLEGLDIRLESDAPDSATHSLIEVVVLYAGAIDNITLFPLCANTNTSSQIGTSCDELEAEADGPPIALLPPKVVPKSSSRVYQEVIPGYTVLFVFFLINVMARSFIHESALGTLRRLRIAPVRPTSLLVGKTLPFLFVSLVQTALLFLFGKLIFGMDWGPKPGLLIPVIFCTSLAATSLGLLVATLVTTESQVSAYANLVVITTGLISGSMFPRDWLPDVMKSISLITPHSWALMAYDQLLSVKQSPDVAIIMQCCVALIGFTLLFFAIGTVRFGKVD